MENGVGSCLSKEKRMVNCGEKAGGNSQKNGRKIPHREEQLETAIKSFFIVFAFLREDCGGCYQKKTVRIKQKQLKF